MMLWANSAQTHINNAPIKIGNIYPKKDKSKLQRRPNDMRRRIRYKGLKKHISEERRARLNEAWQYLTPWQRAIIYIKIRWHSTPTLYQIIEHIKYFYLRWLTLRIYRAHWIQ